MSFVKRDDIKQLKIDKIEYPEDINIFIDELVEYLNTVWCKEFTIKEKVTSLDILNKKYLENYPSRLGYEILSNSFTSETPHLDILSDKSKLLLGYFYGITFRYYSKSQI